MACAPDGTRHILSAHEFSASSVMQAAVWRHVRVFSPASRSLQVVLRQARDAAGRMAGGLAAMVSAMAERAQQPRPSDKGEAKL